MNECQQQSAVVCIDSYENRVLTGRLFDPRTNTDITFRSTMEFLKETDSLLSDAQAPQSFSQNRAFQPAPGRKTEICEPPTGTKGHLATFLLKILFRKNASWQGSVSWIDGKLEESFRSALELLMLIDSAIAC